MPAAQQALDEPGQGNAHNNNTLDDLMGVFGTDSVAAKTNGDSDLLNGFATLDMGAGNQPPPVGEQMAAKKNNEDILGLF